MFEKLKKFSLHRTDDHRSRLEQLLKHTPIPVFWLFGKTQSGKTSIIKFLSGADDAEIGQGFKPCTRFSREYRFPTSAAPLLIFLDTRGLEEPGYDEAEDLARFNDQAHVLVVTARLLDFAMHDVVKRVRKLRASQPSRPVVLALTCLHEAYPQEQHPEPYPFRADGTLDPDVTTNVSANVLRAIDAHREQFEGLYDYLVPIDLTPAAEGFNDSVYGGQRLKEAIVEALPAAYRQTLLKLDEATRSLQDLFEWRALPHILGFSTLAATAGAIPIPLVDLFILPGIQTRMVFDLARLYGQPLSAKHFLELASTLGLGIAVRQGIREFVKFIPFVGSIAGAAVAASTTFALGKAFCYYYGAIHKGHVPNADELKHYYRDQLAQAEKLWSAAPAKTAPSKT